MYKVDELKEFDCLDLIALSDFIEVIKDLKNKGEFIIFTGAGVSKKSGLPSKAEFEKFFDEHKLQIGNFQKNNSRLMIFWRNLLTNIDYNDNHTKILRLLQNNYSNTVITSNYDLLYEKCINKEYFFWLDNKNQRTVYKKYLSETKFLLKSQGDIEQINIDNIHLALVGGKELNDVTDNWEKIFTAGSKKVLWVTGYRGSENDICLSRINNSIENNSIYKIYWTIRRPISQKSRKLELENIIEMFTPEIVKKHFKFIYEESIEGILKEIENQLYGMVYPDSNSVEIPSFDEEIIYKAYEVASKTISLLEKIDPRIIDEMQKAEDEFNYVFSVGEELPNTDSKLYVLRRYNSYTPILPRNNIDSKGGGYFLIHKGKGIVIDPGYDFIKNFLSYEYDSDKNFRLNHIHAIIITHAHNDHYGDFDSIQNMVFQYNKRIKLDKNLFEVFDCILANKELLGRDDEKLWNFIVERLKKIAEDAPKYAGVECALDIILNFKDYIEPEREAKIKELEKYRKTCSEKKEEIKIDLLISRSAYESISGLIPIERNCFSKITILNVQEELNLFDINLKVIEVNHRDLYGKKYAIGLKFELKISDGILKIGFTSDTGYFCGLENDFKDCDILVAHIGSIKPKELSIYNKSDVVTCNDLSVELNKSYLLPKLNHDIETAFYENHLGLLGLNTLLATIVGYQNYAKVKRTKYVIISEYGEEMSTFRTDITNSLNEIYKDNFKCITGDIGLTIDFNAVMDGKFNVEEFVRKETHIKYTYK